MARELQFHFSILLQGDMTPYIPSWVELFRNDPNPLLFQQIIDIGLGSVYKDISMSLQSKIIDIFPSKIKYKIKQKKRNKSLQFIELRQKISILSKTEFTDFLCGLCALLSVNNNLFAKILQFGFEQYKNKNLSIIIDQLCSKFNISPKLIVERRNNEETTVCGYCRNYKIPSDIMHLCYYYYFMLYLASNKTEIMHEFGNKYGLKHNHFINWQTIKPIDNICDLWDKSITNKDININTTSREIERVHPVKHDEDWQCAFGSDIISFGQRKVWNIKITPCLSNVIVGIIKCNDINKSNEQNTYNLYKRYNKNDDFSYQGFGYMASSGIGYYGLEEKKITNTEYWDETLMKVILDMTNFQCTLEFFINDQYVGIAYDKQLNATHKYRFAVAMYEQQKIQLLQ